MITRSSRLFLVLAFSLCFLPGSGLAQTTRNLRLKAHIDGYPPVSGYGYAACWSYIHSDGREYAVIGARTGTAIYNVTIPDSTKFVAFIPGKVSTWRELKQYRDWIYVVTEQYDTSGPVAPGLQIIRMTNPEAPVLAATYATNFQTSHTVSVDSARAILICNGTRRWPSGEATGMRILSLATPEAPVEIGWWPGGTIPVSQTNYVHDSVPIGNRLYAASIYAGIERIIDFTVPASPVQIHAWTYPGAFCHNSWPDATGNVLYVTDEVNGQPLKIFDISTPTSPVLANAITSNPQAIVHNAHVLGSELYLSNYTEGIRVLDISDPLHPAEFAWADSWPGVSGGFNGVWEVCPFFPSDSGTVIASDMSTGLYVYQIVREYGILRVKVVDQASGDPLEDVEVHLVSQGDSLDTGADGIVQFAPGPGMHSVVVHKFGYESGPVSRLVSVGSRDTIVIEIPTVDFAGTLKDASSLAPLAEAQLKIDYAVSIADAAGQAVIADVPNGSYRVEGHQSGYIPVVRDRMIDAINPDIDLRLVPAATYDNLEAVTPWIVSQPGDNATSGIWTRVDPLGTGSAPELFGLLQGPTDSPALGAAGRGRPGLEPEHEDHEGTAKLPGSVQPEYDRTPAPGTMCYVTGQGTTPSSTGEADVDGGMTSLVSPSFNMTGMARPTIGYWRWFYGATPPDDWLAVFISNNNGINFVPVDTVRGVRNSWEERTIRVADYVTPTAQVRLKFIAADFGTPSVVEAAIDDIVTYDAPAPQVGSPTAALPARLAFRAPSPNPSGGVVHLSLELPRSGRADVDVVDVAGRRVRALLHGPALAGVVPLQWDGLDQSGRATGAGIYFVRAQAGGEVVQARIARVR